ncbi:RHS repeat-associated core domain-containing protein [Marinobacter zhejiangensis]|nr:RHS repeat-associated core domain-containing protein [Marinobacter zhejiangensis]
MAQNSTDGLGFARPDIEALKQELRESLAKSYDDLQDDFLASLFLGHEQVLEVNGEQVSESASEDQVVSSTVAPCQLTRTIKIAHFHENIRRTPIPDTRFEVQENTGNWFWDSWDTVHLGSTNKSGVAEVEVVPGREYRVILSPQVTKNDLEALYRTYESFVEQCCEVLDKSWNNGVSAEWDNFLAMGSVVQVAAIYLRYQEGIVDGFTSIIDDIRRIYDVICGLLDYDFDNLPEDLRDQLEVLKQSDEAYLKACLVANDEIFLFLVMYTIRQYFRMLAPTQLAESIGNVIGQILFDVVVGLLLTGGTGLAAKYGARIGSKVVESVVMDRDVPSSSLAEFLGNLAEVFQQTMEDLGTKHRPLQMAGGGRLDTSGTVSGDTVGRRSETTPPVSDGEGARSSGAEPEPSDTAAVRRTDEPDEGAATPVSNDERRETAPVLTNSDRPETEVDLPDDDSVDQSMTPVANDGQVEPSAVQGNVDQQPSVNTGPSNGLAASDQVAMFQARKQSHAVVSERSNDVEVRDEDSPSETDQGRVTQDNDSTETSEDPISTVTGEEMMELVDARLAGPLPFEFKRLYRSGSSDRRLDMGYGWRHSLNHSLSFSDQHITWHDHEGKNTRLPALDDEPFGINSRSGMAAWKDGEEIVVCAGEKAPRYHFRRDGERGLLSRITDRYGNELRLGYDLHGRLQRLVNDAAQALAFEYQDGYLVTVSLFHRRLSEDGPVWDRLRTEQQYSYDDQGDLVAATNAVDDTEHYQFDNHMLVRRTLAGGYSFHLEWDQTDPMGRCVRQWGDSAQVDTRFEWDDDKGTCTVRYVDGSEERWQYDGAAQLQEKIDPDGARHLNEYDEKGRLLASVDPMGARTEYRYDNQGRLTGKTGPDGIPVLLAYRKGRIAEIHRQRQCWKFDYTSAGDLACETDPKGRKTRYSYSDRGQLLRVDLPDGRYHRWDWNDKGQLLEAVDPAGAITKYRYDEFGQLLGKKDGRGAITQYRYDALGRVTDELMTGNRSRRYEYNSYGKVTRFVDEQGRETRFEYGNNLHLLTRRINPDGSELKYRYDHHRFLLTHIENERGEQYRIDYYPNGLVREETAFDGHSTGYEYDLNGHLLAKAEYGLGREVLQTTSYERDTLGQLLKKTLPDGREIQYRYDADGKLLGVDDGKWPLAFEYDNAGVLKAEHQGWATFHYRYDDYDRLAGMVLPDGQTLGYQRDAAGLLAGIDLNGQPLSRHRLSAMGDEIERVQGDLISAYVYDDQGRLTQHRLHQQRVKDIVAQRDYQYDPNGNLKAIQDSRKGLREYVYDPMDRLVGVRGDLYEQLIHDPAGNLLEQVQGASSDNKANVRGNRLLFQGDSHYHYDDFGNLIEERRGKDQKLVTRYAYDCEHRLTEVTLPDGKTVRYDYDAFGRRIAKDDGLRRTEFLWQGDRLIAEECGDQYRTYLYEPDSFRPLALIDGHGPEQARVYYYHLDHLGTPQELTNAQGHLVWSVTYRAYGNVLKQQVAEIDNPLRFQGQYHDPETGLHYNRHRYYNPTTGRFLTPDPIGLAGGLNNYQYVPNPTGWVDPLGLKVVSKDKPDRNEFVDGSQPEVPKPEGRIPWITPDSLPEAEERSLLSTLSHIDAGTKPSGKLARKWGVTFKNWEGNLPGAKGNDSPYQEFRVQPAVGEKGAGTRRIVRNRISGETYYTWTHYGDTGNPAFVRIR